MQVSPNHFVRNKIKSPSTSLGNECNRRDVAQTAEEVAFVGRRLMSWGQNSHAMEEKDLRQKKQLAQKN